jgi:hypothetical protein
MGPKRAQYLKPGDIIQAPHNRKIRILVTGAERSSDRTKMHLYGEYLKTTEHVQKYHDNGVKHWARMHTALGYTFTVVGHIEKEETP